MVVGAWYREAVSYTHLICNTVSEIVDGIVQTSDIAARIIAQRHRVTQLCPKYGLMLILEAVESNVQFKATVGAQQHQDVYKRQPLRLSQSRSGNEATT